MDKKIILVAEARELGLKRYYTGKLCKYGHVSPRMVSNRKCLECLRQEKNVWNAENLERRRKTKKEWDIKNKEHIEKYAETYLSTNEEVCKKRCRDWHTKNKRHHAALNKAWRDKNKDYSRQQTKKYREDNRDKIRENTRVYRNTEDGKIKHRVAEHNRNARMRESGGKHTAADIKLIKKKQHDKCVGPNCKKSIKDIYHIDHRIAVSKGGTNNKDNIDLLCPSCNMRKKAKHPIDFAQENGCLL